LGELENKEKKKKKGKEIEQAYSVVCWSDSTSSSRKLSNLRTLIEMSTMREEM
jgi:hypothetical protein